MRLSGVAGSGAPQGILVVAVRASCVPAWRASCIDSLAALREE